MTRATVKSRVPRKPKVPATALYKVLVDGRSCHGGSLEWSLPTAKREAFTPGDWHAVSGDLQLCWHGLHLTTTPAAWWKPGCTIYAAEATGRLVASNEPDGKVVVARARLLRPLNAKELAAVNIFTEGVHTAKPGLTLALGNSTVTARGNSTVTARENSTVTAWGNSTVTARENSTVKCPSNWYWGAPTVKLEGRAVWIDSRTGTPKIHAVTQPEYVGA